MPKRDTTYMNAQRDRLILAAIKCIAKKGVKGTSIADIWKEAGLSAGALYVHFENKDDLVAHCLRFELAPERGPPRTWAELKARMLDFNPKLGLDAATVTRARVHMRAECINPGELHDIGGKFLSQQLDDVAGWLDRMASEKLIGLRMSAQQTAAAICAHTDGMLWIALAIDRSLDESLPEISAALDKLVSLPDQN